MKLAMMALALVQLLATCSGPAYQRPDALLPQSYRGQQQSSQMTPPMGALGWWEIFKDPELQALIRAAVAQNYDERIAIARVQQAQAQLTIVAGNRYPQLNAVAGAQFAKIIGPQIPYTPREEFLPSALLTLQYEVDLFGKVRSETAAAGAAVLQSEFARETVISTVVSSVAHFYFQLRELDVELFIAKAFLRVRTQSLKIVQERYRAGKGVLQDVAQAQELVAEASAAILLIQRDAATIEDAINILLGNYPGAIPRGLPLQEQIAMPSVASAGLPSQLLEQRPDIRTAEQNLISANAQIGVARALLFPQFTIGASVGGGLAQIDSVNYPEGVISILPQIVQQLFNSGAAKRIHQGVADVSDALIAYNQNRRYAAEEASDSAAAAEALRLANIRFVNGKTSFLDVLVSESRAYDAEIGQARAQLSERLALVQLYHATGGGWQPEPVTTQPSPMAATRK